MVPDHFRWKQRIGKIHFTTEQSQVIKKIKNTLTSEIKAEN